MLIPCSCFVNSAFALSAFGPSGFLVNVLPRGPPSSSAIGRIGSGPPRLLDLWSSSLAMVLAICARGGSGSGPMEGYRIVLATLGLRAGMGSGTPLRDLDLGTLGVAIDTQLRLLKEVVVEEAVD